MALDLAPRAIDAPPVSGMRAKNSCALANCNMNELPPANSDSRDTQLSSAALPGERDATFA